MVTTALVECCSISCCLRCMGVVGGSSMCKSFVDVDEEEEEGK